MKSARLGQLARLLFFSHTSRGATTNKTKRREEGMNECSTGADNGLVDSIPSPTLGLRAPGPTTDPLHACMRIDE